MKAAQFETIRLDKIVGGGQTLGELSDGKKAFVWGGIPGELVTIKITKKKSRFVEGVITDVIEASTKRVAPRDEDSYISTSPWQIMSLNDENFYKSALIEEAFEMHNIVLPDVIDVYADKNEYGYRNKVEFSWFSEVDSATNRDTLDLAFHSRGSKGKVIVDDTSLAREEINILAKNIRNLLRKKNISARQLKTLIIRCDQEGKCVWQLYTKEFLDHVITENEAASLPAQGGEIIFSEPKSPASVITKRLCSFGITELHDEIADTSFSYACESFFQINIPVYKKALADIKQWTKSASEVVDLYSGVGTIGLTTTDSTTNLTLVEINKSAVAEMKNNIKSSGRKNTRAVLAPSEQALEYITHDATIIVDPPRAGLHKDVVAKLLDEAPKRIIYLSCNPVTQARDIALLGQTYGVRAHQGYNFFPHTPHIEHLVILDKKSNTL